MANVYYYTFLCNVGVWFQKAVVSKILSRLSLNVFFILILLVFVVFLLVYVVLCCFLLVFDGLVRVTMLCTFVVKQVTRRRSFVGDDL